MYLKVTLSCNQTLGGVVELPACWEEEDHSFGVVAGVESMEQLALGAELVEPWVVGYRL